MAIDTESSGHRLVIEDSSPLRKSSVLQLVFESVGPGHGLFLNGVCSEWRALYQNVREVAVESSSISHEVSYFINATGQMTLISATFESPSRLRLLHKLQG
jgi:hypothetical protein